MSRRPAARALLAVICLLAGACSQGAPKVSATELVIAVDAPLTGPQAAEGAAMVQAVKRVVALEFHSRIEGLPVRVAVFDDSANLRRDPAKGEQNLRLMVANPHLVGVVGPLNSDVAAAEIPVATAAHLVLVSPSASHACLTRAAPPCGGLAAELRSGGPNGFFRVVASDDGQAAALLEYLHTNLHVTKVAVASDSQASGKWLADSFEASARHRGIAIAVRLDLDPTADKQVDAFLTSAKSGGAEAVFFGGDQEGGACRVRARMKGVFDAAPDHPPLVPFLGAGSIRGATCLRDAGTLAPGMFTAGAAAGDADDATQTAARVLLRALATGVKRAGGNAPTREEVRLAVSRSADPAFDARGDLREQAFTIYRSDATPAWVAAGKLTVSSGG